MILTEDFGQLRLKLPILSNTSMRLFDPLFSIQKLLLNGAARPELSERGSEVKLNGLFKKECLA